MKALSAILAALASCCVFSGCSTHRNDLEANAPPQGLSTISHAELASIAISLLNDESSRADLLSSDALAPLTEAASIVFMHTGSTRAVALVRQFAGGLLSAQITRGGVSGFFGASGSTVPRAQNTALSGLALVQAYAASRDRRYQAAARAAAVHVTSPALGWVSSPIGDGVRVLEASAGPNVALTANAALLLKRVAALGETSLAPRSRAAFHTIYASQAAVGRWYASVGGRQPMTLAEWGTTLYDLSADGSRESLGVLGAGVPGLYANAFAASGKLLQNGQTRAQPIGVALALRALGGWEDTTLANRAYGEFIKLRRPDGTIRLARADDTVSQAYFALALAQWLAGPAHGE